MPNCITAPGQLHYRSMPTALLLRPTAWLSRPSSLLPLASCITVSANCITAAAQCLTAPGQLHYCPWPTARDWCRFARLVPNIDTLIEVFVGKWLTFVLLTLVGILKPSIDEFVNCIKVRVRFLEPFNLNKSPCHRIIEIQWDPFTVSRRWSTLFGQRPR